MKQDIAIFTMTKNEEFFLPKWVTYYKSYFDVCDMYVLDDSSTDNSIHNISGIIPNSNIFTIKSNDCVLNLPSFTEFINSKFNELLTKYKYVLYTDVDEFLVCSHTINLRTYIDQQIQTNNCLIATGWELYHYPEAGESPQFDFSQTILSQRQYVNYCPQFNKVVGANYDVNFAAGQHTAYNEQPFSQTSRNDPNLLLIHAKRFDINYSLQRYLKIYPQNYSKLIESHCVEPIKHIFDNNYTTFLQQLHGARFNNTLKPIQSLLTYNNYYHLF